MTVQQLLRAARQQLCANLPAAEAAIEAQLLLMQVLAVNRAWLLAHATDTVTAAQANQFDALLQRRLSGEPVAHILGHREFFGLRLQVTADTLIPRPDTETLVEAALDRIQAGLHILDLGTGSGAIALAIARHAPACQVTAVDASLPALQVAIANAQTLGLNQIRFLQSDWFAAVQGTRFDLIVSNPPYIEAADPHLQQGDLRFEPLSALASGADGLQDIRHIVQHAPLYLHTDGWLLLEHGYDQSDRVQALLKSAGFQSVQSVRDLGGHIRVTLGQWRV